MNVLAYVKQDFGICGDVFTTAQKKAGMNTILIPAILSFGGENFLYGLTYILFMSVVYLFIQKEKVENKKAFFIFLKYEVVITLLFMAVVLALNI